jgi:hypothetical protein
MRSLLGKGHARPIAALQQSLRFPLFSKSFRRVTCPKIIGFDNRNDFAVTRTYLSKDSYGTSRVGDTVLKQQPAWLAPRDNHADVM